ncbi:aspartate aminotransferase family protein [Velocimicrobium porci]|uniref:Acetylornithine aminotransferase n=1 Tax=Velocimicrobium porci TaxID=2606634 RepID=A0A6L5Y0V5_9FIRM|nr:aspartate aminotransferase family protein [Velocimicrobium porci]MSS64467.1 aspartate aminotransferase family protein [Velocimicrobium porci]
MKDDRNIAENYLIHTYNRYPIVFDYGKGVYLYDDTGKRYLDFASGIGVFALGYGQQEYNQALKAQIDKIIHTSNYFYSAPLANAAKKLVKISNMKRVFFCNSGAEAIEGAIKIARKYGHVKKQLKESEIISLEHSFHGRSTGALALTGNITYQEDFFPLMQGVKFAKLNDIGSVKEKITDKTCAIILEPIQGEGGIYPAKREFLVELRKLCDERDILLIFDEIQCGMGRSGSMYVFQEYGILPDVLTTAKALGCGIPVGAFLVNERAEDILEAGDHGTTYGGNPLACVAVDKVLDLFEKLQITEHVKKLTPYLESRLNELVQNKETVIERRGKGFMQGLELQIPAKGVINKAIENGLIVLLAGTNVIRFLPPLIIEKHHIDEMFEILFEILE